jgi:hypothetical protein
MPQRTKEFLKLARDRFRQAEEADQKQREREIADLKFYAGEQWDEETLNGRKGQAAKGGMPPSPPRPSLVINKTREPIKQITNAERQAEIGVGLVAADDFDELEAPIDPTEVELREGLIRKIQRDSDAQDARSWAFSRAVICGRGYYIIATRYLKGDDGDQEIYVHRIYNQASVSLDPAHERPDGSDAAWEFIGTDMSLDRYAEEFGERKDGTKNRIAQMANASKDEWRALGDVAPGWFTADGDTRSVRVVDYFYTEYTKGKKQIKWCKIDGSDDGVLDETDWPGPDMPIIKVVGEELHPYDDERRIEGMVRPARDSNMGFNAMASKGVELIALNPVPPLMIAEGQTEGYEPWYQAMTTRLLPFIPYRTRDLEGNPVGAPSRAALELPYQPVFAALNMFDQAIKSTTGVGDPQLGNVDPSLKSGKVVEALKSQSQHGTSHFMSNLQRSMRYEGQIINNLLYPIYGTSPGRLVRIMTGEGKSQPVRINQPPATNGTPPPPQPTYTLTKEANFNIIVKATQSPDSKREQEALLIGELLQASPILMTWFGDLFFSNQDGPGHLDMAERAKVMLDPKILAMLAAKQQGNGSAPLPPQIQQQLAQIPQMQQALQQAQQTIQTDQIKHQAQIQIEQMKLQAQNALEIQLAHINNAAKIEIARITAAKEASNIAAEAAEERLSTGLEQQHDAIQGAMDRAHDVGLAAQQHDQTLQQGQQAAALAPSPAPASPDQSQAPPEGPTNE